MLRFARRPVWTATGRAYSIRTYYDILGADEGVSQQELRRAYLQAMQRAHPDRAHGRPTEFAVDPRDINHAYRVLRNSHRRVWYDRQLAMARYPTHLLARQEGPRSRMPVRVGLALALACLVGIVALSNQANFESDPAEVMSGTALAVAGGH